MNNYNRLGFMIKRGRANFLKNLTRLKRSIVEIYPTDDLWHFGREQVAFE